MIILTEQEAVSEKLSAQAMQITCANCGLRGNSEEFRSWIHASGVLVCEECGCFQDDLEHAGH